jgi:hypothetical protein
MGGQMHGPGVRGEKPVQGRDFRKKPARSVLSAQVPDMFGHGRPQVADQGPGRRGLVRRAQKRDRLPAQPEKAAVTNGARTSGGRERLASRSGQDHPQPPSTWRAAADWTAPGGDMRTAKAAQKSMRLSPASRRLAANRKARPARGPSGVVRGPAPVAAHDVRLEQGGDCPG